MCPRVNKKSQHFLAAAQNEIGYIKTNFFNSFGYQKPSVTMFVFNWKDYQEPIFDWRVQETHIIEMLKKHSESW